MKIIGIIMLVLLLEMWAHADEPRRPRNYILRRQEAGQVQGVPTDRVIVGRREIDVYRNGLMFEGDNVVGIKTK